MAVARMAFGQEGNPEVAEETIKQLVFIEAHLDDELGVDGVDNPYGLTVSPDGKHVYVASMNDSAISIFSRSSEEGTLVYEGRVKDGENGIDGLGGVRAVACSPDGKYAYSVSMFDHALVAFSRDASTGDLSYIETVFNSDLGVGGLGGARSIAMAPDGKHMYVAGWNDDALAIFSRDAMTGAVSFQGRKKQGELEEEEPQDQQIDGLIEPHFALVSPDGANVYVVLWGEDAVSVFDRDPASGLLDYKSKLVNNIDGVRGLDGARSIGLSPDGEYAYVASWNDDSVSVFSRDTATGELSYASSIKNGAGNGAVKGMDQPHSLFVSTDGNFVYVAVFGSDAVTSFERDRETGELSYFQSVYNSDEAVSSMNGPIAVAASPDGEHVYVTTSSDDSLVVFRREVLEEPPVFVVEPVSISIEEDETVAFHALAQGVEVTYQWSRNGVTMVGETLPVLTIDAAPTAWDGSQFMVTASNSGGWEDSSLATLTVLPPIVLEAPRDLTVLTISNTSAQLAWNDASNNETSFEIQRKTSQGMFAALATVNANQSQYDDTTLSASTTYLYRVRSKRNQDVSLWSNEAVIESHDDPPQAPANLTLAEQEYNRVLLTWSDRSAVEDGFRIQRREDALDAVWADLADTDKNATEYEDRTVSSSATYAYRVQAFNETGVSAYSSSVVALTSAIPVTGISPTGRAIPSDDVSGYSITVQSTRDWEAIPADDWLIVTSPENGVGVGNQPVEYRALKNESQVERIGTINVGGVIHTVVQEGSEPFLRLALDSALVSANGGSLVVEVQGNEDWTASETEVWVSITSGQTGSGYGSVVVSVDANPTLGERSGTLAVNALMFTINQLPGSESTAIEVDTTRFPAEGGSGHLTITSNTDWKAVEIARWMSFVGPSEGFGNGEARFTVASNPKEEERSVDIRVNGESVTVTQDAYAPVISSIAAPSFTDADIGSGLGVALSWSDNSDTETGFLLQRSKRGGDDFDTITQLGPDVTSYFDREASRRGDIEYRLAALDSLGQSLWTTVMVPALSYTRITGIVTRVEFGGSSGRGLCRSRFEGEGSMKMTSQGFGTDFSRLSITPFGGAARIELFGDRTAPRVVGPTQSVDWEQWLDFTTLAFGQSGLDFDSQRDGFFLGFQSEQGSDAFSGGIGARGYIGDADTVIVTGFAIEGGGSLPILIKGVGSSLKRIGIDSGLADPLIDLYSIDASGAASLIASNDDWSDSVNTTQITFDDAVSKTGAMILDVGSSESVLLVNLSEGHFACVLRSADGSIGDALLEVYDAR